jgi:hypothetical protein
VPTDQQCSATSLTSAPSKYRQSFRLGLVDAKASRPYALAYESMSVQEQIAYECGRYLAVGAVSAGIPVPSWNGTSAAAHPVDCLILEICMRHGTPWPPVSP